MTAGAAILLLSHGGPSSAAEVPAFLEALSGRKPSAQAVDRVQERYARIGGSPLMRITEEIAASLAGSTGLPAVTGYLYTRPSIEQAVDELCRRGVQRVLAICLSPFASDHGTGACISELRRATERAAQPFALQIVERIGDRAEFLDAVARSLQQTLAAPAEDELHCATLFTAHSLPASSPGAEGYGRQFLQAAEAVAHLAGLPADGWAIAYQSAPPVPGWLQPSAESALKDVVERGTSSVVVAPIGFVADQLEVLFDIDVHLREQAAALGMGLRRLPLPNAGAGLLATLSGIVREHLAS